MGTFEVGQKVIVTGVTLYGSFAGCEGVIIKQGMFHDWLVDVTFPDGTHDDLSFDADELRLAPASATGDGAVDMSPDVVIVTSDKGIQSRSVWVNIDGFDTLFVEASAVSAHVELAKPEIAALREQLAAAQAERDALQNQVAYLQGKLEKADYEHEQTREQTRRFSSRLGRINIMLDEADIDIDNGYADERIAKMFNRKLPEYPLQSSE